MRLVEEILDRLRHHVADAADGSSSATALSLSIASTKASMVWKLRASSFALRLAHMADAERIDEAVQRDLAARIDRSA